MNYSFTNKNKRNKYKKFCENYSKFYFNFLIINNLFKIKNIMLEKKIIYLILIKNSDLLQNKYNYKSYYKDINLLKSVRAMPYFVKIALVLPDKKLISL